LAAGLNLGAQSSPEGPQNQRKVLSSSKICQWNQSIIAIIAEVFVNHLKAKTNSLKFKAACPLPP